MQFVVVGYDGEDIDAPQRRLAARPAHIELGNQLRDEGRHLYAVALLDKAEKMIGSVLIVDFASRDELDRWLEIESYITGGVWKRIEVLPCRVGPSFQTLRQST